MLQLLAESDIVTNRDKQVLRRILKMDHNSCGSYHMIASTRHPHMLGFNHVHKQSPSGWPQYIGRHAEAHLCKQYEVKGKTIYIAGRNNSGSVMKNTEPCQMCKKLLIEHEARRVVFFANGRINSEVLR